MDHYERDFEEVMLTETGGYYKRKAAEWINEDSCPEYMLKVWGGGLVVAMAWWASGGGGGLRGGPGCPLPGGRGLVQNLMLLGPLMSHQVPYERNILAIKSCRATHHVLCYAVCPRDLVAC